MKTGSLLAGSGFQICFSSLVNVENYFEGLLTFKNVEISPLGQDHRLPVIHLTDQWGKRRGTHYMFSRPFRKHGVVPLATYMQIYKKGDVDLKGRGIVQK